MAIRCGSFVADDGNRFARGGNRQRCEFSRCVGGLIRARSRRLAAGEGLVALSLSLFRSRSLDRPPVRVAFRSSRVRVRVYVRVVVQHVRLSFLPFYLLPANFIFQD